MIVNSEDTLLNSLVREQISEVSPELFWIHHGP
jgi:hypothetical protein